jgi:hypothetical protein
MGRTVIAAAVAIAILVPILSSLERVENKHWPLKKQGALPDTK